jgi:hypothetical protein
MKKVSAYISKIIDEYIDNIDLNPDEVKSIEDLSELIDPDTLAKEIVKHLQDKILKYQPVPKIDTHYNLSCPKCNRLYGSWFSPIGTEVNEHLISTPGKRIIIIDDIS